MNAEVRKDETMDLFEQIATFLHLEAEESTGPDVEIHYEINCPLCEEDGFARCQGHPYTEEGGYLD